MTNRSNTADRPVRAVLVYASGKVSHRDLTHGRAPWNNGIAWGRAGAHALPNDGPGEAPPVRVKNPAKVAAGKARAAQAAAAKKAKADAEAAKKAKVVTPMESAARTLAKAPRKAKAPAAAAGSPNAMVVLAVRVTPAQKKKYDALGADWLRARIDAATPPAGGKRK